MERRHDDAASRLLELAALSALVLAAGTGLSRVFARETATPAIVIAGVAALVICALLRRLRAPLALPVAVAATTWAIAALSARGTLSNGLPTIETLRALAGSVPEAAERARSAVAPVAAIRPFLVSALAATGATTLLAHTLLVRARRPLLAIVPPLIPVAFADLSLGGPLPVGTTIGLVLGCAGVVLAAGLSRVLRFGRVTPELPLRRSLAVATRGARAPAILAVAIAVLLPGLLPGYGGDPLLDVSGALPPLTRVKPFVSIKAQLTARDRAVLFHVRTVDGEAAYWRLFSLDRFDGASWSASPATLSDPRTSPVDLPFAGDLNAPTIEQEFELMAPAAGGGWLPMAYPAREISFGEGMLRYDGIAGTALLDEPPQAGDRYTVTSLRVAPTASDLEGLDAIFPESYAAFTALPADLPAEIGRIAREWTDGETSQYRKVLAIQRAFLDGSFRYSLDVGTATGSDALVRFLLRTRRGFCQQFATAMAVLVRSLGYPARVAVGFRQGIRKGSVYTVSNLDAHSWVEVLFPRYGWLAFEPTPGRPNPLGTVGSYLNPVLPSDGDSEGAAEGGPTPGPAAQCTLPDGTVLPAQLCRAEPDLAIPDQGPAFRPEPAVPDRGPPLIPIAVILLLAIGFPLGKTWIRRRRLGRSSSARARALAGFGIVASSARDLGFGREDHETRSEFAARIADRFPDLRTDLMRLVSVADRATYAEREPDASELAPALETALSTAGRLRRESGVVRRVVGLYRVGL